MRHCLRHWKIVPFKMSRNGLLLIHGYLSNGCCSSFRKKRRNRMLLLPRNFSPLRTLPTSSAQGVRIVYSFRPSCMVMTARKWFHRRKTDNSRIFQVLPLETEIYVCVFNAGNFALCSHVLIYLTKRKQKKI